MIVSPSKEDVRRWLQQRRDEVCTPSDNIAIRRQLGWELVREAQRELPRDISRQGRK